MRVSCDVEETYVENFDGVEVQAVRVTCSRCGHSETSFGRSEKSVRRCCVLLGERCPEGENNFYVTDE